MAQLAQMLSEAPPAEAPAARRFYQPELDGLRFYAFLGVFIYHTLPSQPLFYRRLHLPLAGLWAAIARSGLRPGAIGHRRPAPSPTQNVPKADSSTPTKNFSVFSGTRASGR